MTRYLFGAVLWKQANSQSRGSWMEAIVPRAFQGAGSPGVLDSFLASQSHNLESWDRNRDESTGFRRKG